MAQRQVPITADVVLGADAGPFHDATVRARLEEVSFADAPSRVIDQKEVKHVQHPGGVEQRVRMTFRAPPPTPTARYVVRAHVAVDGQQEVQAGDYISTQSYPVLTGGAPNHATIAVKKV